ncbi:Major Facilitator Superfamily protein [Mariniphaga anaerophila]|uniref:Lysosomal dipeptide transporter MFSD1 n=1 Tax=Mariniphaga anaerophila TaxID=1484053 RepID=A0A1M5FWZ3_9BACT|nr:MFS transporter [Mariniphaga anaerophila]SHF96077.1 Major Facilitator Superfamily protein [Mariniphaga anaerophila]
MNKSNKILKDSAAVRWLVLVLVSSLMFATYYFQDFFSPLRELMETDLGINSEEFGRVIGLTTIANMFGMIIIGGIILDKWGIRLAGLAFGGLATLGGIITALASMGYFGDDKSSVLAGLIVGRILFGSGLEVVCVVVTRTIVKWFKGYELALAMAINMGFGRLGSALAIAISLDIAGVTVSPAVVFAATLIGLSLIFFVVYLFFDIKMDKQIKAIKAAGQVKGEEAIIAGVEQEEEADEDFKFSDLIKLATNKSFIYIALLCVAFYSAVFPFIQYAPDLLVNKFGFSYVLPDSATVVAFGSEALGSSLVFVVIFIFALSVTLIPNSLKGKSAKRLSVLIIVGVFAVVVYLVRDTLGVWLVNGPKTASLIPLGTIIFTPIFGSYVDKKGKAASLMILGALLLIFAHLSLSVFQSPFLAYMGLLSLGIAFSLVPAAMWPSVAKIVAENRLGTAYASMFTVQNWGLGAFFWGIGALLYKVNPQVVQAISEMRESLLAQGLTSGEVADKIKLLQLEGSLPYYDYTWPILMLVACGVISIFLAFKLKQADKEQGYGLELPSGQKPE